MPHYLNLEQLLEEASNLSDKIPAARINSLELAAQALAEAIVAVRGDVVITEDANNQPGFGGLCVGFGPVKDGDKCPADFIEYDSSSTWAEETMDPEDETLPGDDEPCTQHRNDGRGVCADCGTAI